MSVNKSRNARTTNEQLEVIVNFLEQNKIMLEMKSHPLKINEVKILWQELAKILNNTQKGARKTVEEWKRFLITWKSKTKTKARIIKKDQIGTGGGPAASANLTDFEQRLMFLIGWNTIEGCDSVAEELLPDQIEIQPQFDIDNADGSLVEFIVKANNITNTNEQIQAVIEKQAEPEATETIMNSPPVVPTPTASLKKRRLMRKKCTSLESPLDNAAKVYMESSKHFSQSAILIAASIDKLALAFTKYAEATLALAEAKKQKYANKPKHGTDESN